MLRQINPNLAEVKPVVFFITSENYLRIYPAIKELLDLNGLAFDPEAKEAGNIFALKEVPAEDFPYGVDERVIYEEEYGGFCFNSNSGQLSIFWNKRTDADTFLLGKNKNRDYEIHVVIEWYSRLPNNGGFFCQKNQGVYRLLGHGVEVYTNE